MAKITKQPSEEDLKPKLNEVRYGPNPLIPVPDEKDEQIAQLQAENKKLWDVIEFTTTQYDKAMSFAEDSMFANLDSAIEKLCKLVEQKQALKAKQ